MRSNKLESSRREAMKVLGGAVTGLAGVTVASQPAIAGEKITEGVDRKMYIPADDPDFDGVKHHTHTGLYYEDKRVDDDGKYTDHNLEFSSYCTSRYQQEQLYHDIDQHHIRYEENFTNSDSSIEFIDSTLGARHGRIDDVEEEGGEQVSGFTTPIEVVASLASDKVALALGASKLMNYIYDFDASATDTVRWKTQKRKSDVQHQAEIDLRAAEGESGYVDIRTGYAFAFNKCRLNIKNGGKDIYYEELSFP